MPTTEGFLARLIARLSWPGAADELDRIDPGEVDRLAGDMGLSGDELRSLARKGTFNALLLDQRMAALGLTKADVDRTAFGLMRELERTCCHCPEQKACAKELAEAPGGSGWKSYCPNVQSLAAVQGVKGRFPV